MCSEVVRGSCHRHLICRAGRGHLPPPRRSAPAGPAPPPLQLAATCKPRVLFPASKWVPGASLHQYLSNSRQDSTVPFGCKQSKEGARKKSVADLLAAVSARFGLRSEPSTAMSGRTPKYLPLPHPTSASIAPGGSDCRNAFTCKMWNSEVIML